MSSEGVPPQKKEAMTDMEFTLALCLHIDQPCEAEGLPGEVENMRSVYLREAILALPRISDEYAKEALKSKLRQYGWDPEKPVE